MSALAEWRKSVKERGLSSKEKNEDLRKNVEAYEEFKAQRNQQQRKRRWKQKKKDKKPSEGKMIQFIQMSDGVEMFYVDLIYLGGKGHSIKPRVYAGRSAEKIMKELVRKCRKKSKSKYTSDFDLLYQNLSKKKKAYGHDKGCKRVHACIVCSTSSG